MRARAQGFHDTWEAREPQAVAAFFQDFEQTLCSLPVHFPRAYVSLIRTTNLLERFGLDHRVGHLAWVLLWWVALGSGMGSLGWVTTDRTPGHQAQGGRLGRWGRRGAGGGTGRPVPLRKGTEEKKYPALSSTSRAYTRCTRLVVVCSL